jgi:large subunit ribosomal protein L9
MKIVLRTDVAGVGKRGDILDVADGYALAIPASDGIASQAAAMRRSRDLKDTKDRESAETVAQRLVPMTISIPARSGREGKLFGSVTSADVLAAVEEQAGVVLDRHSLLSHEPIKELGLFEIGVRLHAEVEFSLSVEVIEG